MSLSAAIEAISGFNECVTFWQWAKSAISSLQSRWSGSHQETLQGRVLQLQSDIQRLSDTLPTFYDLINGAEWRCHDHCVAELLPRLKDAVADAEDLLHEFRSYEKKAQVVSNSGPSPFIDFLDVIIQGSFDKLKDAQLRLNHLSSQLGGLPAKHTGKLARFTSSIQMQAKIVGRDRELEQILGCLIVPRNSKRKRATCSVNASTSTSTSNHVGNRSRISSLRVLPIAGIGGVGKTTLATHIYHHKRVKSHFDLRIWICVTNQFDVKRLTLEAIEFFFINEAQPANNLDNLQHSLKNLVDGKRLLMILDDVWDDALREDGDCWKRFLAPFSGAQEGSAVLVTTRCSKVTEGVRTMEPIMLEGLQNEVLWDLFKDWAFGFESSNNNPELERIGKEILPKLKGSPLAARTLARMLRANPEASHWNYILESELWELKQEVHEILPALRLSYIYLPFYLKRCFAFCAVYPKKYKFEKARLAEIWVAVGYVEPEGRVPIQDIGCQYFEDLVERALLQEDSVGADSNSSTPTTAQYVIHDLLHDMAQKVSEHDCFILKNKSDFDRIPQNVRHLYVHPSGDLDHSDLLRLCKYMKLRTIICEKILGGQIGSIMGQWCTKLPLIRVICCASEDELLDGTGNWQHLQWSKGCFKK